MTAWQTARVGDPYDLLAPDGSEIRLLVAVDRGSMVHCTLQPGQVTQAVRHQTVEEVWFCVAGAGQVWRRDAAREEIVEVEPGKAVSIPLGTAFQFRSRGDRPLEVVITTMPPWPGSDEAEPVPGVWKPSL